MTCEALSDHPNGIVDLGSIAQDTEPCIWLAQLAKRGPPVLSHACVGFCLLVLKCSVTSSCSASSSGGTYMPGHTCIMLGSGTTCNRCKVSPADTACPRCSIWRGRYCSNVSDMHTLSVYVARCPVASPLRLLCGSRGWIRQSAV